MGKVRREDKARRESRARHHYLIPSGTAPPFGFRRRTCRRAQPRQLKLSNGTTEHEAGSTIGHRLQESSPHLASPVSPALLNRPSQHFLLLARQAATFPAPHIFIHRQHINKTAMAADTPEQSGTQADIVVRGDIIEFLRKQRCAACQARERDCIMKRGASQCILCSDSGRFCIFERMMSVRGSADQFTWDALLAKESLLDLQSLPNLDE